MNRISLPVIMKVRLIRMVDLRDDIDAFFDNVMVNADDEKVKTNRLNLLMQLRNLFLRLQIFHYFSNRSIKAYEQTKSLGISEAFLCSFIKFSVQSNALNVQVSNFQCVRLDELTAWLYLVAHQRREELVRSNRIFDGYLQHTASLRSMVVSHSCSGFISPRPL